MDLNFLNKGSVKGLNIQFRAAAVPLLSLLIIIVTFFVLLKMGISQVRKLTGSLAEIKKEESMLRQKEEVLSQINDSGILNSNSVIVALPEKNPTLFAFSQLRNLAVQKGVVLSGIKISQGAGTKGITEINFSFTVDGPGPSVNDFISGIRLMSPLSLVEKADFGYSGSAVSALLKVNSYYSEFPKELPPLTSQLEDITQEEKDLLEKLALLSQPAFNELSPDEESERTDPFVQ